MKQGASEGNWTRFYTNSAKGDADASGVAPMHYFMPIPNVSTSLVCFPYQKIFILNLPLLIISTNDDRDPCKGIRSRDGLCLNLKQHTDPIVIRRPVFSRYRKLVREGLTTLVVARLEPLFRYALTNCNLQPPVMTWQPFDLPALVYEATVLKIFSTMLPPSSPGSRCAPFVACT